MPHESTSEIYIGDSCAYSPIFVSLTGLSKIFRLSCHD